MSSLGLLLAVIFVTGLKYVSTLSQVHVKCILNKFVESSKEMNTTFREASRLESYL